MSEAPGILWGERGFTAGGESPTHATTHHSHLERLRQDVAAGLYRNSIEEACRQAKHRWRKLVFDPATTIYFFLLEVLHDHLGRILAALNAPARALAYLQQSLAMHGSAAVTYFYLAESCHLLGRDAEAHSYLDQAHALDPTAGPVRALRIKLQARKEQGTGAADPDAASSRPDSRDSEDAPSPGTIPRPALNGVER